MLPCDVKYGLRCLYQGREGVVEQISGHPRRGFSVKFQPSAGGPVPGGILPCLCVPLNEFAAQASPVDEPGAHDPEQS